MDPLSELLIALAAKLAEKALEEILDALPRKLRRSVQDNPEQEAALRIALQAGLEAALKAMEPPDRYRAERYAGLMERFLKLPKTAEELTKLVDLRNVTADPEAVVNITHLENLFREAYPVDEAPEAYAGLNFPAAMRAFLQAYAHTIKLQPDKLPWINTAYLDAQLSQLIAIGVRLPPRPTPGTLREQYLGAIAREGNQLPWSVYDPRYASPTDRPQLTLQDVYVPLEVILSPTAGEKEFRKQPEPEFLELQRQAHEVEPRRAPALTALVEHRAVVLLGDPGTGKTTFTNHLALCLAMDSLAHSERWLGRLPDWPFGALMPVHIPLRELAAKAIAPTARRGRAGMLWDFLELNLHERGLEDYYPGLRTTLTEEGGIFLLDGLDEVPEADGRRVRVREAIQEFADLMQNCRFVVTCRTYAYQDPQEWLEGFQTYPVALFSPEQVETFIDGWYEALAPIEQYSTETVRVKAAQLKAAVDPESNPHLADLASRPLLLTLMADVHTSWGTLPEDRADLYAKCVDLLLVRWQQRKVSYDKDGNPVVEVGLLQALGVEKSELERVLFRVAYEVHERQGRSPQRGPRTADILESDLRAVLEPALGDPTKFDTAIRYIRDRAGLLLWSGKQTYTFPHRSFQEYLAACHLSNLPDPVQATRRCIEDDLEWWREVYLLEVGRLREYLGLAVSLVDAICPEDCDELTEPTDDHWRALALAGRAMVELRLVQQIEEQRRHGEDTSFFEAKLNRVRDWLKALLETGALPPVERAAAGDTLVHLGDPRPGVGVNPQTGLPDIVWCEVPAGPFLMGTQKEDIPALVERLGGEAGWYEAETPQHKVTLPAFYISRYLVTNAQFAAFVEASDYQERRYWTEAGWQWKGDPGPDTYGGVFDLPNHPVVGVSWYEAVAFCRWLTEHLRENGEIGPAQEVTLPTEAQWEKASRGTDGRIYPWGNEPDPNKANYDETGIGATSAVGCFPGGASPCGALDMSGNVWEWTRSLWGTDWSKPRSGIPTNPMMVVRISRLAVMFPGCCVAARGPAVRGSPAAPAATGPTQTPAATVWGFGWRLPPALLSFVLNSGFWISDF
ncbi:MAG: SUMF1/EgtB/PvdO family nonheme iron enzyme [Anaerolineae bacterium]